MCESGPGSCSIAGCDISGVERSGSATTLSVSIYIYIYIYIYT
jgi:hypothetical protein